MVPALGFRGRSVFASLDMEFCISMGLKAICYV